MTDSSKWSLWLNDSRIQGRFDFAWQRWDRAAGVIEVVIVGIAQGRLGLLELLARKNRMMREWWKLNANTTTSGNGSIINPIPCDANTESMSMIAMTHNDGGMCLDEPSDTGDESDSHIKAIDETKVRDLPQFMQMASLNLRWGEKDAWRTFAHLIDCCYEEIVNWRWNLFKIPLGKAGKSFVCELIQLFRTYADGSALECIVLKATIVLPVLMLQKPHQNSKAKDHFTHLDRQLRAWSNGDINSLMLEGRTIQRQLKVRPFNRESSEVRSFSRLTMGGKIQAALRSITDEGTGSVIPLTKEVQEALWKKQPPLPSAILDLESTVKEPHFILFEQIDGHLIRETALWTNGAAGPSGLDAAAWKRLCSSFAYLSAYLCDALASIAK